MVIAPCKLFHAFLMGADTAFLSPRHFAPICWPQPCPAPRPFFLGTSGPICSPFFQAKMCFLVGHSQVSYAMCVNVCVWLTEFMWSIQLQNRSFLNYYYYFFNFILLPGMNNVMKIVPLSFKGTSIISIRNVGLPEACSCLQSKSRCSGLKLP